jgi:hypothetical protein
MPRASFQARQVEDRPGAASLTVPGAVLAPLLNAALRLAFPPRRLMAARAFHAKRGFIKIPERFCCHHVHVVARCHIHLILLGFPAGEDGEKLQAT